jgi:hypothetical protein
MKKTIFISIMVIAALVLSVSCSNSGKTPKNDSYTVTFDLRGGKCEGLDTKQTVKAGDTVDEPVFVPTASDDKYYRFDYWAKADGTEYNFSTTVTSDITLHAKYKERYKVGEKDSPSGGYTFYENKNYVQGSTDPDKNWKYLEVSSKDYWENSTKDTTFEWGSKESIETSTAINSGSSNTEKMSKLTNSVAKNIWNKTRDGGKTDWYIPSKDELALIFKEVAAKGNGNFSGYYWSSSANGNDSAWNLSSAEGGSGEHSDSRDAKCHIRLIRKF